ncbi:MAG: methyltransferase domain-containing protein [Gemmatimonadetes bacterium]|nr:methyltransferase domain-containing protein [Gemmatimonadota bacterium]
MTTVASPVAEQQESLEAAIKGEVIRMYHEVAEHPENEFHFYHGRLAAEMFDYDRAWLDRAPPGAVASFAGVGNPHRRSRLEEGEVVVDVGSGAGLDSIIAGWQVGPAGRVIGVDLNPEMLQRAAEHARAAGLAVVEFRQGRMEELPVEDQSAGVVISNGVINLSFQKRRVLQELFRVLRPGGRISVTDIVSAKQLKQTIVNDPKLWAS